MSGNHRILTWLQAVSEDPAHSPLPATSRKRKADSASIQQPISPPSSYSMSQTPVKRRRAHDPSVFYDPDGDFDQTPRANLLARTISEASLPSSSHGSVSGASSASGTSSHKRQRISLQLSDSGVEWASLNKATVPVIAKQLFNRITEIGRGLNILPERSRPDVMDGLSRMNLDQEEWRYCFKPAGEGEEGIPPGRIPSYAEVTKIMKKATECENHGHEEASWNAQVHMRLLEAIFQDLSGDSCDDFDYSSCTTARPHKAFKPRSSPGKMIDICIYHSLAKDETLKEAMADFSVVSPTLTVNHTDFEPIRLRPLLISIETKKPGVEWEKAKIQIGVWHAAQWAFLRWSVGQKLLRHMSADDRGTLVSVEGKAAFTSKKLEILDRLGFIPGVIVQGNRWHLVLSTYNNGKTTLWADWVFGSTKSEMDIYAVVAGIRKLTAWGKDAYLPWFKQHVLG